LRYPVSAATTTDAASDGQGPVFKIPAARVIAVLEIKTTQHGAIRSHLTFSSRHVVTLLCIGSRRLQGPVRIRRATNSFARVNHPTGQTQEAISTATPTRQTLRIKPERLIVTKIDAGWGRESGF
jgi:hypothetical protein